MRRLALALALALPAAGCCYSADVRRSVREVRPVFRRYLELTEPNADLTPAQQAALEKQEGYLLRYLDTIADEVD